MSLAKLDMVRLHGLSLAFAVLQRKNCCELDFLLRVTPEAVNRISRADARGRHKQS